MEAQRIADREHKQLLKERIAAVKSAHTRLRANVSQFLIKERPRIAPCVPSSRLNALIGGAGGLGFGSAKGSANEKGKGKDRRGRGYPAPKPSPAPATVGDDHKVKPIGHHEPYIKATLRKYQVEGVNWLIGQYNMGVGGILGDEMGLGKTIQTLSFISALKHSGLPGPHLVVTPLAVLQNWANEINRFTPDLSFVKVHGSVAERDRILTDYNVVGAEYDIYLTTYDVILNEESFFTESFLFHTITIDEGHRLKNEASSLCTALSRISVPFRILLTGTPLQNNLHELWALLNYILPQVFTASETFDDAVDLAAGNVDEDFASKARDVLEPLMLRRVKSEVEALLPKLEYILKVPLTPLQRTWYQKCLAKDAGTAQLMSYTQMLAVMIQLQKICNHPKNVILQFDHDQARAEAHSRRAAGSEFVTVPTRMMDGAARAMESQLRSLSGERLIAASGKLALLDRLLMRVKAQGSRVLIFSQYTLTLDVLAEYATHRFGPIGTSFLRLDGSTNRIIREMDVRAFNAPDSQIFIYLISTKAGGQGINLATADVVVLYDTCWNPQVDLQAQDRAHRIGQKKQVKVYRLIHEDTIEEKVLARSQQKLVLDALVIKKGGGGALSSLTGAWHNDLAEQDALVGGCGDPPRNDSDDSGASDEEGDGRATKRRMDGTQGKMSLKDMWETLSYGAGKQFADFDPSSLAAPMLTASDYDAIIDNGGKPTGGKEIGSAAPVRPATTLGPALHASELGEANGEMQLEAELRVEVNAQKLQADTAAILAAAAAAAAADQSQNASSATLALSAPPAHGAVGSTGGAADTVAAAPAMLSDAESSRESRGGSSSEGGVAGPLDANNRGTSLPASHAGPSAPPGRRNEAGRRGTRERKAPKVFQPPPIDDRNAERKKRRKLKHDNYCFSCDDGGDLLECQICPRVYHLDCVDLKKVPKGTWICPWHACWECNRKSSAAGGMLFHCMTCPQTFCFDCIPERYARYGDKESVQYGKTLESQGVPSIKSYLFFTCEDCETVKRQRLEKIERERQEWLEQQRRAQEAARREYEEKARIVREKREAEAARLAEVQRRRKAAEAAALAEAQAQAQKLALEQAQLHVADIAQAETSARAVAQLHAQQQATRLTETLAAVRAQAQMAHALVQSEAQLQTAQVTAARAQKASAQAQAAQVQLNVATHASAQALQHLEVQALGGRGRPPPPPPPKGVPAACAAPLPVGALHTAAAIALLANRKNGTASAAATPAQGAFAPAQGAFG